MAYGQAAVSQTGQTAANQMSALSSQLGTMWYDTTNTISDVQWTLMGLQGDLGLLMSKRPMTDAERQQMMDRINKANTDISQWNSKKQDLANRLSTIQSRIDYSAMSPDDAARARANMNGLRSLVDRGDIAMSQMKTTIDMINKYK
jgi:SMC interacting uncharacterized protein involved in chromosome segregation